MKKGTIILLVIVGIIVVFFMMYFSFKNSMVTLDENVEESWGNVETAYQRRNDLIGNLVKTVKGAADYERETLKEVIEARAKATSVTIDPSNITPEQLQQFNQAQGGLSSALSRLLVTVERYPDLKANQNFLKLQDELASTENQILTARTRYNESVKPYNTKLRRFPGSLFNALAGFDERPYFKSEPGAERAPDVEFDFSK